MSDIEIQRLEFERQKFEADNALERFRVKWISGLVAVLLAVISAISGITVASIEYLSNKAEIKLEEQKHNFEKDSRNKEQEQKFLENICGSCAKQGFRVQVGFCALR